MSYVNYISIAINHLKSNNFSPQYIRMNLRHQKCKDYIHFIVFPLSVLYMQKNIIKKYFASFYILLIVYINIHIYIYIYIYIIYICIIWLFDTSKI